MGYDLSMRLAYLLPFLLCSCADPGLLFYTGALTPHDQAVFREAALIEGVEVINNDSPSVIRVEYKSIADVDGRFDSSARAIYLNPNFHTPGCPRDQDALSIFRHEIGHAKSKGHSSNPASVMYYNPPCWPDD